jgi:hypothetical protein
VSWNSLFEGLLGLTLFIYSRRSCHSDASSVASRFTRSTAQLTSFLRYLLTVGIPISVNLPGVGANLQVSLLLQASHPRGFAHTFTRLDHPLVVSIYRLQPGVESLDNLLNDPVFLATVRSCLVPLFGI